MKKSTLPLWISLILLCAILIIAVIYFFSREEKITVLPTYFSYTPDQINSFEKLSPKGSIDIADLQNWDNIMFNLVRQHSLADIYAGEIYASVYTAQRDAAFLAFNAKHKFAGNLNTVSKKVLCLYFSDSCSGLPSVDESDMFSNAISTLVTEKIRQRQNMINTEDKINYPEITGPGYWSGNRPYFAQAAGSWKPWLIQSANQFRVPPPPDYMSAEAIKQLDETRAALKNITDQQKIKVVFWAGGPGTITPLGQWLKIANEYMWAHNLPLQKILLVRSVIAMGMVDSGIAAYDSKYTYWYKRPFMFDNKIVSVMPTPNHPSYPAGHSTFSAAAAAILKNYFPENSQEWQKLSEEAGNSRVWGGIHFPMDNQQGAALGEKVGNLAVERSK